MKTSPGQFIIRCSLETREMFIIGMFNKFSRDFKLPDLAAMAGSSNLYAIRQIFDKIVLTATENNQDRAPETR